MIEFIYILITWDPGPGVACYTHLRSGKFTIYP